MKDSKQKGEIRKRCLQHAKLVKRTRGHGNRAKKLKKFRPVRPAKGMRRKENRGSRIQVWAKN